MQAAPLSLSALPNRLGLARTPWRKVRIERRNDLGRLKDLQSLLVIIDEADPLGLGSRARPLHTRPPAGNRRLGIGIKVHRTDRLAVTVVIFALKHIVRHHGLSASSRA